MVFNTVSKQFIFESPLRFGQLPPTSRLFVDHSLPGASAKLKLVRAKLKADGKQNTNVNSWPDALDLLLELHMLMALLRCPLHYDSFAPLCSYVADYWPKLKEKLETASTEMAASEVAPLFQRFQPQIRNGLDLLAKSPRTLFDLADAGSVRRVYHTKCGNCYCSPIHDRAFQCQTCSALLCLSCLSVHDRTHGLFSLADSLLYPPPQQAAVTEASSVSDAVEAHEVKAPSTDAHSKSGSDDDITYAIGKVLACRICYDQLQYQIEWGGGVVDMTWYAEAWVLHRWKLAPPYDNPDVLKQLLSTVKPTTTISRKQPANKRAKKSAIVEQQLPAPAPTAEPMQLTASPATYLGVPSSLSTHPSPPSTPGSSLLQ